jgi:hypothetical protein
MKLSLYQNVLCGSHAVYCGVFADSDLLDYNAMSLGGCFPAFQRHFILSKHRKPLTQRHSVTSQKA